MERCDPLSTIPRARNPWHHITRLHCAAELGDRHPLRRRAQTGVRSAILARQGTGLGGATSRRASAAEPSRNAPVLDSGVISSEEPGMARFDDDPNARNKQQSRRHAHDESWYDRWISSMADDVASKMMGEEERAAHMQALRDRFNQLRRRLTMRRSGFRGIGPRGYQRPDDRIREEVNDRLTNDPYIDATEIEVSVDEGVVTLNGTVENRAEKRLVEDCVDAVPGVRDVTNNLRIREMERAQRETDEGPAVNWVT